MKRNYPHLFSPITVRGKLFKNRIISAPIGAWIFSPENYIFDYVIDMFQARAAGGAASVTVGHTEINAHEQDSDGFGMYFDLRRRGGTAALSEFADAIRSQGAHASIELNYGGVFRPGNPSGLHYGPSGFVTEDGATVLEMDETKIAETIGQYADCAARMKNSGFDMVTIHAAHGWLPEQFLSKRTNHRTDRFGGSLENRMRFPLMLIDAVRARVGEDFLIEYRMGGVNPALQPEEFEEILQFVLAIEDKIDILHLSTGIDVPHERTIPTYYLPRALNVPYAQAMKRRGVRVPIAIVGAISDPETADRVIREGVADFVAMGRSLLADPNFPQKARAGKATQIRPCIGCMHCLSEMHKNNLITCTVNPRCGHEHRLPPARPAGQAKQVAVVGGGPAGLQAAITAAERGHSVTLYERDSRLGGLLNLFERDGHKQALRELRDYLCDRAERSGVRFQLNTEVTPELLERQSPDVVLVAVGARPIIPDIPGVDGARVFNAVQAYRHPEALGKRVLIVGGNLSGCELAIYLRGLEHQVMVAEMREKLHFDANPALAEAIENRLVGISLMTNTCCTAVTENGARLERNGAEEEIIADSVVLATGLRTVQEDWTVFLDCAPEVTPIGDCLNATNLYGAIHSGFNAAYFI